MKRKKTVIKLSRKDFNREIMKLQTGITSLGIKNPEPFTFYLYTDEYGTLIELVCDEKLTDEPKKLVK